MLTLETELSILDKLSESASQSRLASEYRVGKSTIMDLKRMRANFANLSQLLKTKELALLAQSCTLLKMENWIYITYLNISHIRTGLGSDMRVYCMLIVAGECTPVHCSMQLVVTVLG